MRILACPDVHYPFHDKRAVALALKVADAYKPDTIVILGDFVDNYAVSSHDKDAGREGKIARELAGASVLVNEFRKRAKSFYYLEGNHETRLQRYLNKRAPELHGLVNIRDLVGVLEHEWRPYGQPLRLNKCHFVHDVGYCGQDAARKSLNAFGGNLVFGHSHRAEIVYDGNLRGERHFAVSSGWLGNGSQIDYAPQTRVRQWQHGVTLVNSLKNGNSWATFVPFVGGKAIVEGKEITV